MYDKMISINEAAKLLNKSTETLRRWDNSGKFKCKIRNKINNYREYSEADVLNLVNELQLEIEYTPKSTLDMNDTTYNLPFHKSKFGKLYKMDAIDFLKQQKSNSVDLIFADPPYNIKKASWDSFSSQDEYIKWSLKWVKEAHRVLKDTGSIYICGFSEILADVKSAVNPLFASCKWLIWFYRNKANLGKDWGRSHESILHFRKSKSHIFNIDQIRIPYNDHTTKYPKRSQAQSSQYSNGNGKAYTWEPNPLGAKPKDVLEIPTISNGAWEKYPHETQKPVELLKKIILSSSNSDSIILDPFGGSGTTFAVAEAFRRKWIGCELELKYCEIIRDRLNDSQHLSRIKTGKDESDSQKRRKILRG